MQFHEIGGYNGEKNPVTGIGHCCFGHIDFFGIGRRYLLLLSECIDEQMGQGNGGDIER